MVLMNRTCHWLGKDDYCTEADGSNRDGEYSPCRFQKDNVKCPVFKRQQAGEP
jgi:Zn-finger protein